MGSNLSSACRAARSKPFDQQITEVAGWQGTVSAFLLFASLACFSCLLFFRRLPFERKAKIWHLYPMFALFSAVGCALSFVAHVFLLLSLQRRIDSKSLIGLLSIHDQHPVSSSATLAQYQDIMALSNVLYAVYFAFQPIGFICISGVKLLVLERMLAFSFKDTKPEHAFISARSAERWRKTIIVLLGISAVGSITSGLVSTVYWIQTAHYRQLVAVAYATNSTFNIDAERSAHDFADKAAFSQLSFEIVILFVILLACTVLGLRCASIVKQQSERLERLQPDFSSVPAHQNFLFKAKAGIRSFRLRAMSTAGTIIVTFFARSAYDALSAAARFEPENSCNLIDLCDPCQPFLVHLNHVLIYTPSVQAAVSLVSEPITVLIALWGMTRFHSSSQASSTNSQMTSIQVSMKATATSARLL